MQVVTQLEHRGNHQTCYINQTNKPRLSICVPTRIIGALGQFFLRREMIISFNNLTLVPDFSTRCRDQVQDQHKDSTHYHEDGHELEFVCNIDNIFLSCIILSLCGSLNSDITSALNMEKSGLEPSRLLELSISVYRELK